MKLKRSNISLVSSDITEKTDIKVPSMFEQFSIIDTETSCKR